MEMSLSNLQQIAVVIVKVKHISTLFPIDTVAHKCHAKIVMFFFYHFSNL